MAYFALPLPLDMVEVIRKELRTRCLASFVRLRVYSHGDRTRRTAASVFFGVLSLLLPSPSTALHKALKSSMNKTLLCETQTAVRRAHAAFCESLSLHLRCVEMLIRF